MALFSRRPKLDPAVADVVHRADPGDRVVAFATVPGGRHVVASVRGLWWPLAGDEPHAMRRIAWELIDKAVWRDGNLVVVEAEVVDDLLLVDRPPAALPLDDPGDVPAQVKRRVEGSVVRSEIVPVTGGQARIVARRVSGRDGLTWLARLEGSTPDNPITRDQVSVAIARLRDHEAAQHPQL